MTTNGEWLDYLAHNAPDELAAWFDAEHVETKERALDGDTAAQDGDSRDKLEADVRKIAEAYNMDTQRHGTERFAHELYYSIIHLLERQAAITEREYGERMASEAMCSNVCAVVCEQRGRIAELQAQVDKLTSERERYREKFGKCLDYADAIHALMDDEGMA